jgi:hypothetical protein
LEISPAYHADKENKGKRKKKKNEGESKEEEREPDSFNVQHDIQQLNQIPHEDSSQEYPSLSIRKKPTSFI